MTIKVLTGEALETLRSLPSESVNCIVTSPPYYGLRDYGTASWDGGDPACEHQVVNARRLPWANDVKGKATADGGKNGTGYSMMTKEAGGECAACGAIRVDRQIGLEETPDEFVSKLVDVFREARRVLRDDGVMFLNIGDSYAGSGKGGNPDPGSSKQATNSGSQSVGSLYGTGKTAREAAVTNVTRKTFLAGAVRADGIANGDIKAKDLIGIPWMVAFALRADGWYLRQEIIWAKPNPMPESVRDRCTKSHEHVFLLSKSQRYLFDAEAISEPVIKGAAGSSFNTGKTAAHQLDRASDVEREEGETRNKRDVWTIATEPSSIAHYAMMPTELARICIMAGCPLGGTVIDPFGGAGTTGLVADRLQRSAILIELSPVHAETARTRLQGDMGMFGDVS